MAILHLRLMLIAWCFEVHSMPESFQFPPGLQLPVLIKPLGEERVPERGMFS